LITAHQRHAQIACRSDDLRRRLIRLAPDRTNHRDKQEQEQPDCRACAQPPLLIKPFADIRHAPRKHNGERDQNANCADVYQHLHRRQKWRAQQNQIPRHAKQADHQPDRAPHKIPVCDYANCAAQRYHSKNCERDCFRG
jgi:hypothetical protein